MNYLVSVHWVIVTAIWYLGNGILHDFFVLANHKGKYDRELLRLLMDGHVLIVCGLVLSVCYFMMLQKNSRGAAVISIIIGISMLLYCAMIFPFLKSFLTIAISVILIIVAITKI